MPGTLYVVATPIGNMADITLRALSVLREVDLIAAEDTRVTRKLLDHYGIETPTTSYHQYSVTTKAQKLADMLLAGRNIALASDAGTPGISDPGHEIVCLAIANSVPVVPIPGANSAITALAISGLTTRRFAFDGFPPRRGGERRALFADLKHELRTMVFYESPNRLVNTLKDMQTLWGDRQIAVVREATKMFEQVHRGTIGSAIEHFTTVKPKGEITIVVAGSKTPATEFPAEEIEAVLREFLAGGMSERDAVRRVSGIFHVPKNEAYRYVLRMKEGS